MVGFGDVENGNSGPGTLGSLRYLSVNDTSYPEYNYASLLDDPGQPTSSAFKNRSDVKVWWRDGGANLGGTVRKGDDMLRVRQFPGCGSHAGSTQPLLLINLLIV